MKFAKWVVLIGSFLMTAACIEKKQQAADYDSIDELQASVESGITAVSGTADEQSNASFADNRRTFTTYALKAKNEIWPEAWAAACGRAVSSSCNAGTKEEIYNNCSLPFSFLTMNGLVTLAYSNSSCDMSNPGDSVERTFEVDIYGLLGGNLNITSANHIDYRGNTIGGGGRLTKIGGSSWEIEVLGKRKRFVRRGRELMDVSVRTLAPLNVTGSLSRVSRVVDGGAFEVIHNKAQFTATYQPSNLAWSNACCHPVSGTLNVNYSGSIAGSGSITFNGCGSATLTKDGLSRDVSFNYCE